MDRRRFLGRCSALLGAVALPLGGRLPGFDGSAPAPRFDGPTAASRLGEPPTFVMTTMRTRAIPSTGEEVPVIGLGTWQTFDPPTLSEESLAPLREVLRIFHEAGGRLVDSSPMYGKSEEVTGTLSTQLGINRELFIATKVWTTGEREGIRQMRQSMAELRRDRVELMQIHNLVDWRTHLGTLRRWKDEGLVKYIGITHYTTGALPELAAILEREAVDFVQLAYSVAVRDAEERVLPLAADRGVAVLVNRPFEGGGLFARARGRALPPDVREWASSWGQAFLAFILAHPAVTAVIPATSNPAHMRDNVEAGRGRLPSAAERRALLRALSLP